MAALRSFLNKFFLNLSIIFVSLILLSCGGGNEQAPDSSLVIPQDEIPDYIEFENIESTTRNITVLSNVVTVTGIDTAIPIRIVGGEYQIDGNDFTSEDGTVVNGQTIRVRVNSSGEFDATVYATVYLGDIEAGFSVTTEKADINPDFVEVPEAGNVNIATLVGFNGLVVEGINTSSPVVIQNGEYSIDNGSYTSESGEVTDGQEIKVRHLSSPNFDAYQTTELKIGDISLFFRSRTRLPVTKPNEFAFELKDGVELNQIVSSGNVVITGIEAVVPVVIENGEYSINNGGFVSEASSISPFDNIRVRHTSSDSFNQSVTTFLTIGGVKGSFSSTTRSPDIVPNVFSFPSISDVEINRLVVSDEIAITGIEVPIQIETIGGEYSIDGGAFVSTPGLVEPEQRVRMRLRSSSGFEAATSMSIQVGSVSATFQVITRSPVVIPDAFSIQDVQNAERGILVETDPIQIGGIEIPVPIIVRNGEYSLDNGPYLQGAGQISPGQTLKIRTRSSLRHDFAHHVIVNINGVVEEFSVTTISPPNTKHTLIHPPPSSVSLAYTNIHTISGMTESSEEIVSVSVNGIQAVTDNGFNTWTASVPLEFGLNAFNIVSVDASGGIVEANPDNTIEYRGGKLNNNYMALDEGRNKLYMSEARAITVMDISTGYRQLVTHNDLHTGPIIGAGKIKLDLSNNRIFITGNGQILEINISTGVRRVVAGPNHGAGIEVFDPTDFVLDLANNRMIVLDNQMPAVLSIDIDTGDRSILSSPTVGEGAYLQRYTAQRLVLDSGNNIAYVAAGTLSISVIAVDLANGNRTALPIPESQDYFYPRSLRNLTLDFDPVGNRLLFGGSDGIIAMDIGTGIPQTIISPSDSPYPINTSTSTFLWRGVFNSSWNKYYAFTFTGPGGGSVTEIDLTTKQFKPISNDIVGSGVTHEGATLVEDTLNSRVLVLEQTRVQVGTNSYKYVGRLIATNLIGGEKTIFSDVGIGAGPDLPPRAFSMLMDKPRNRILIGSRFPGSANLEIMAVSLNTGNREIIAELPNFNTSENYERAFTIDTIQDRLLAGIDDKVVALDLKNNNYHIVAENLGIVTALTYVEGKNQVILYDRADRRLLAIDLATGDILSSVVLSTLGGIFTYNNIIDFPLFYDPYTQELLIRSARFSWDLQTGSFQQFQINTGNRKLFASEGNIKGHTFSNDTRRMFWITSAGGITGSLEAIETNSYENVFVAR